MFVVAIGSLGNQSLAVLYISVCVFVFAAPAIVSYMGEKWAMFWGAVGYIVYMASVIHVINAIVLASSVIIGLSKHKLCSGVSSRD